LVPGPNGGGHDALMSPGELRSEAPTPQPALSRLLLRLAVARQVLAARTEEIPPPLLLGVLAAIQWIAVTTLALRVPHEGWLYYRPDEERPSALVVSALPAIVLVQVLVMLPLTLVLVHRLARRLGGRLFAAWAAAVWVALPYLGLPFANQSFRHPYAEQFLPRALGLTADPAFPAMVAFLAAAFLCLRALETNAASDIAGTALGAALGVAFVPRAAGFVAAPLVALALARRWRLLLVITACLTPLLAGVVAAEAGGLLSGHGFGHVSLSALGDVLAGLRERFWSARLLEWLAIAGALGALRGSRAAGSLTAVWLTALALTSATHTGGATGMIIFLRGLVPSLPAFGLLLAAIPLLAPREGAAPSREARPRSVLAAVTKRATVLGAGLVASVTKRATALGAGLVAFVDTVVHHPPSPVAAPATTTAKPTADRTAARAVATPLWARTALAAVFVLIAFVGVWNAARYPVMAGYDATEHIAYADSLIYNGRIPGRAEGGEYYTPPGYYALAGAATWIGEQLGMTKKAHQPHPYQAALYLNVVFVLATAALLLVLARLVFPRRPGVWVAAVGFFALVPVVPKTAAMFHPETLNMLVSTAAVTLATWMLLRRRFELRWLALLGLLLGAGQLVRASSLFTFIAIALGFVAALASRRFRRRMPLRTIAIAVAGVALVATPWYVRQAVKYKSQPVVALPGFVDQLVHPGGSYPGKRPPFFGLGTRDVFQRPFRPQYANEAIPATYTEVWGDWIGSFSWSGYSEGPWRKALAVMKDQQLIGLLPTLLALAGWVGLWILLVRRRADGIPLLPLALLPAIAMAGYLWRSYALARPDGDLLKASYLLTTAPVWALAFGYAVERVCRYRLSRFGLVAVLVTFAVLELRFVLYGLRDHWTLF
jgi:hypothetical protein